MSFQFFRSFLGESSIGKSARSGGTCHLILQKTLQSTSLEKDHAANKPCQPPDVFSGGFKAPVGDSPLLDRPNKASSKSSLTWYENPNIDRFIDEEELEKSPVGLRTVTSNSLNNGMLHPTVNRKLNIEDCPPSPSISLRVLDDDKTCLGITQSVSSSTSTLVSGVGSQELYFSAATPSPEVRKTEGQEDMHLSPDYATKDCSSSQSLQQHELVINDIATSINESEVSSEYNHSTTAKDCSSLASLQENEMVVEDILTTLNESPASSEDDHIDATKDSSSLQSFQQNELVIEDVLEPLKESPTSSGDEHSNTTKESSSLPSLLLHEMLASSSEDEHSINNTPVLSEQMTTVEEQETARTYLDDNQPELLLTNSNDGNEDSIMSEVEPPARLNCSSNDANRRQVSNFKDRLNTLQVKDNSPQTKMLVSPQRKTTMSTDTHIGSLIKGFEDIDIANNAIQKAIPETPESCKHTVVKMTSPKYLIEKFELQNVYSCSPERTASMTLSPRSPKQPQPKISLMMKSFEPNGASNADEDIDAGLSTPSKACEYDNYSKKQRFQIQCMETLSDDKNCHENQSKSAKSIIKELEHQKEDSKLESNEGHYAMKSVSPQRKNAKSPDHNISLLLKSFESQNMSNGDNNIDARQTSPSNKPGPGICSMMQNFQTRGMEAQSDKDDIVKSMFGEVDNLYGETPTASIISPVQPTKDSLVKNEIWQSKNYIDQKSLTLPNISRHLSADISDIRARVKAEKLSSRAKSSLQNTDRQAITGPKTVSSWTKSVSPESYHLDLNFLNSKMASSIPPADVSHDSFMAPPTYSVTTAHTEPVILVDNQEKTGKSLSPGHFRKWNLQPNEIPAKSLTTENGEKDKGAHIVTGRLVAQPYTSPNRDYPDERLVTLDPPSSPDDDTLKSKVKSHTVLEPTYFQSLPKESLDQAHSIKPQLKQAVSKSPTRRLKKTRVDDSNQPGHIPHSFNMKKDITPPSSKPFSTTCSPDAKDTIKEDKLITKSGLQSFQNVKNTSTKLSPRGDVSTPSSMVYQEESKTHRQSPDSFDGSPVSGLAPFHRAASNSPQSPPRKTAVTPLTNSPDDATVSYRALVEIKDDARASASESSNESEAFTVRSSISSEYFSTTSSPLSSPERSFDGPSWTDELLRLNPMNGWAYDLSTEAMDNTLRDDHITYL